MSIQAWTYLIVGLTFALYIGIAVWSRVRSTAGFYVAGRGVPPLANGMAMNAPNEEPGAIMIARTSRPAPATSPPMVALSIANGPSGGCHPWLSS